MVKLEDEEALHDLCCSDCLPLTMESLWDGNFPISLSTSFSASASTLRSWRIKWVIKPALWDACTGTAKITFGL